MESANHLSEVYNSNTQGNIDKTMLNRVSDPDVADSLNNVGVPYQALGNNSKGLEFCEQASKMYQAIYSGDHPDVAQTSSNADLSLLNNLMGDHE